LANAKTYTVIHRYKIGHCHVVTLGTTKLEIWGKAQRESARRPKSDWEEIRGGDKISSAPKSRGPNSNALAYAERALLT